MKNLIVYNIYIYICFFQTKIYYQTESYQTIYYLLLHKTIKKINIQNQKY